MAMTYSSLQNDIKVWAENTGTDFTNQLENFIGNAFESLSRDIDPIGFNENVTTTAVAGDRFVNLPTTIKNFSILSRILARYINSRST